MWNVLSALTAERVRRDVDVLAHAGLDVGTFLDELHQSLSRAVPYDAACFAMCDPATQLLTSTYKFGDLAGQDERDVEWGMIEYGDTEDTTFIEMARSQRAAVAVHDLNAGDVLRSRRMREFITPYFDFRDELRLVARANGQLWGGAALFRDGDTQPFSAAEIAYVDALSSVVAVGMRTGVLARLAHPHEPIPTTGPAVVIVDRNDQISQISLGAEQLLGQLVAHPHAADPTGVLAALVARARLYGRGFVPQPPRSRVRMTTGEWFVLHAAPLAGREGRTDDVVITIEEARPPEIVPLVVAAFDLTARERDVLQLVLQGVDTKEIAATLHLSTYTVQDHLKSIFEKADVRSRRELVARVFFDQYVPRLGAEIAPSGWFLPS